MKSITFESIKSCNHHSISCKKSDLKLTPNSLAFTHVHVFAGQLKYFLWIVYVNNTLLDLCPWRFLGNMVSKNSLGF